MAIRAGGVRPVELTVARDGGSQRITVTPSIRTVKNLFGEQEKVPLVGIVASGKTRAVPLGAGSAAGEAVRQTWNVVAITYTGLLKLIERVVPLDSLGGPIMKADVASLNQGVRNANDAISLIQTADGALSVIDEKLVRMLPGMDGLKLIEELRRRKVNTPIIILSAKRSVEDRVRGLETGSDDYLSKPFSFSELLARVQALIRRSTSTAEPTRLTVGGLAMIFEALAVALSRTRSQNCCSTSSKCMTLA